jgi:type III secretory pathway component EscV
MKSFEEDLRDANAEIARLKLLNLMTDEQVVMDLKAEIEQLNGDCQWMKKAWTDEVSSKVSEIDRLNKGWTQEAELAARCHRTYEETLAEKNQLITELADALDRSDPILIGIQEVATLIERAREATK